ncbi:MAG: hypothetical protein FWH01_06420 [Oscillospiraceae bacterium]|nr:hypothetical protein [Oscillospiraceae bacterium]
MPDKKELLYKICMSLVIGVFIVALYFNNEATIDKMASASRERAEMDAAPDAEAEAGSGASIGAEDEISGGIEFEISGGVEVETSGGIEIEIGGSAEDEINGVAEVETSAGDQNPSRAFNFTLYGTDGQDREFSDYRGRAVFMVFWAQQNEDSVRQIQSLANAINEYGLGGEGDAGRDAPALIAVCVGDGIETAVGGADVVETDVVGISSIAEFDSFIDVGGQLSGMFLVDECPATYIFYPNGELCDYQNGYFDGRRLERLLRQVAPESGG